MAATNRAGWSRFLDIILTIGVWITLITALLIAVFSVIGAFVMPAVQMAALKADLGGLHLQGPQAYALSITVALAFLLLYWRLILMFRNFFRAIARGEAFTDENVTRLNTLGGLLIVVKLVAMGGGASVSNLATGSVVKGMSFRFPDLADDQPSWLVIIGVFALAEAFRQGAKLHAESQLTV